MIKILIFILTVISFSVNASDLSINDLKSVFPDSHPLNLAFKEIKNIDVIPSNIILTNKLKARDFECVIKGNETHIGLNKSDQILQYAEGAFRILRNNEFRFIIFIKKAFNRGYIYQLPSSYEVEEKDEKDRKALEVLNRSMKKVRLDIKDNYKTDYDFVFDALNTKNEEFNIGGNSGDINKDSYNHYKVLIKLISKTMAAKGADKINIYEYKDANAIQYIFHDRKGFEMDIYRGANSFTVFVGEKVSETQLKRLLSLFIPIEYNLTNSELCKTELHPSYKKKLHNKALKQGASHGTAKMRAAP